MTLIKPRHVEVNDAKSNVHEEKKTKKTRKTEKLEIRIYRFIFISLSSFVFFYQQEQ